MFTGIVREIGKIKYIRREGDILGLEITSKAAAAGIRVGDSVAVNGVCLTVVKSGPGVLKFEIMEETARRSTFPYLTEGNPVNLEGAMKADGAFDGHFVQGHIDCVGTIKDIGKNENGFLMKIGLPGGFEGLYVDKGSVAIEGVSLTISKAKDKEFEVYIIPHTLKETTLGLKKSEEKVNVEFDVIGKYAAKMQSGRKKTEVTEKFLEDKGFI